MVKLTLKQVLAGPDLSTVVGDDDRSMSRSIKQYILIFPWLFPAGENVKILSYRRASHPTIDGYNTEGRASNRARLLVEIRLRLSVRDWTRKDGMCLAKSGCKWASVIPVTSIGRSVAMFQVLGLQSNSRNLWIEHTLPAHLLLCCHDPIGADAKAVCISIVSLS
ncbi:hypothetical protein Mapa_008471 [Marchantia paleacea]|nr:hypothetical protein Mapa_008471 [Marchantia paleacea]